MEYLTYIFWGMNALELGDSAQECFQGHTLMPLAIFALATLATIGAGKAAEKLSHGRFNPAVVELMIEIIAVAVIFLT